MNGQINMDDLFPGFSSKDYNTAPPKKNKRILDPCCGSKMFWFDKNNPDVEYCDIRELPLTEYYPNQYIEIKPDVICDFTNLPFEDETFYLVVFDPPHLKKISDSSIIKLKYGMLPENWQVTLNKGFHECMRVLKPNGVLIFKWSEVQITLQEVLKCFDQKPLFGNRGQGKGNYTHWLCFMKDDKKNDD